MNDELKGKLLQLFNDHPDLMGKPATDEQIEAAQQALGITFHPDYVEFIKLFGGAFGGVDIHAFENGSMLGKTTVTELTERFRDRYDTSGLPELHDALAISDDGSGNPILMNSQGQLYLYLHDEGEVELLAPSLEALLTSSFP
ncbi:SMI1/KNR4 family protein [Pseudomonas xanthosomatis]|uniref:SMI1/KNR4 family protein n=1 Tax=Pseudomonas xanthosomatis TaxID=2842356 RepID=UPI001C3DE37B|nr:SMI1/KNR4 family protein [Pseudomonas xanthosomatis]QXH48217.1 SMI1/KNR4 family protein [Pseudomonas xanthosomatis]